MAHFAALGVADNHQASGQQAVTNDPPFTILLARNFNLDYRLGYALQGQFLLPESDWTTDYDDPMERLLPLKVQEWTGGPDEEKSMAVIDDAWREIAMYRQNSAWYGYAFFVMKRRA